MAGITYIDQVGAIGGMNQAAPGILIPDTFLRWAQDVLFDRAGLIRRRGPFSEFTIYKTNSDGTVSAYDPPNAIASDEETILAVCSTYDPQGSPRIGVVVRRKKSNAYSVILRVFDTQFVYLGSETLIGGSDIANLSISSVKPALGGGVWLSFATSLSKPASGSVASKNYLFFWRGGYNATSVDSSTVPAQYITKSGATFSLVSSPVNFTAGHGTLKPTIDVSLATGPNPSSGMFAFVSDGGSDYYIGTVKDVNTTVNQIVLEKGPYVWGSAVNSNNPATGTSSYIGSLTTGSYTLKFTSVRPYLHKHGRGTISCTSTAGSDIISGTAGTSGEGHWTAAQVKDYHVYRASDNAYIGKVSSVSNTAGTTNTLATLYDQVGVVLAGEEYIMFQSNAINLATAFIVGNRTVNDFAGLYTAVYSGYQWFGNVALDTENTNRVVFSAYHNREAVDLSPNAADSIIFPGRAQFRGMGSSVAGLLVFLEDKTYIIRGNDRTNFSVEQLYPEGCLCASGIVEYGGGVFWPAKSGILYYDGASVRNLTKDNLGLYYVDSLNAFNPDLNRVFGFVHKNNLIMHFTSWDSPYKPDRYEPVYLDEWEKNTTSVTDPLKKYAKRSYEDFYKSGFTYEDLHDATLNTPIYWDRNTINSTADTTSLGLAAKWGTGTYAKDVAGTGTISTLDSTAEYIYRTDASVAAANKLQKWSASSGAYVAVTLTTGQIILRYTTSTASSTAYSWSGTAWTSITDPNTIKWNSASNVYKWGPIATQTSMTFNIYLPTNAVGTLSNMDFRGFTQIETSVGLKSVLGVNSVETINSVTALKPRLIDIETVYDTHTNGTDPLLIEKINIPYDQLVKGPDFFIQTKHFTEGDPTLKKWFQRIMMNMLLFDGALRMDVVDDDDNDMFDVNLKKHQYWEIFTEEGYDWNYLSDILFPKLSAPYTPAWANILSQNYAWDAVFTGAFNRYSKRVSWRQASIGFRLYQLNKYKRPYNGSVVLPNRIEIHSFNVGFKALRAGRV